MIITIQIGGIIATTEKGLERRLGGKDFSEEELSMLQQRAERSRGRIIVMTHIANSGHPGGAMGSADIDAVVHYAARIDPENPFALTNDIIVRSAGHYSAGEYSALVDLGILPEDEVLAHFRSPGSMYEGHTNHHVPTIWWDTGILGQGLSAGVGFALAKRLLGIEDTYVFVMMGDGEQQKGQIAEAARFAAKYNLKNVIPIIDGNGQQLSGRTSDIMPAQICEIFEAAGWHAYPINWRNSEYNDLNELRLKKAVSEGLTALLAETTMAKGYPPFENNSEWHGKPFPEADVKKALEHLGLEDAFDIPRLKELRAQAPSYEHPGRPRIEPVVDAGQPILYKTGEKIECRTAFGNALLSIAKATLNDNGAPKDGYSPIAVVDCDLLGSVQTKKFAEAFPNNFFQCGIMEHHAAAMSGAVSVMGVLTFYADFGVLSVEETMQQQRLNAINKANLKLVSTHCGLDVGEDGKTHQALNYLALSSNYPGWQTFVPADPNQTDSIVRYMAKNYGCMHLAVGRSKIPVITKQGSNEPFFDEKYEFVPGKVDVLRNYPAKVGLKGEKLYVFPDAAILTYGSLAWRAVKTAERLRESNIGVKVLNLATPAAPDKENLLREIGEAEVVVTYEDHFVDPGIGGKVKEWLYNHSTHPKVVKMGVERFGLSGPAEELYRHEKLHQDDLFERVVHELEAERM